MNQKFTIKCRRSSSIWTILAEASHALEMIGQGDKVRTMQNEVAKSSGHFDALEVIRRYVDIEYIEEDTTMIELRLFNKPIGTSLKYWNNLLKSNDTGYSVQGICDMIHAYEAAASDLGCKPSKVIQIDQDNPDAKSIFNAIHGNDSYESKKSLGHYSIDGSEGHLLTYKDYKVVQCEVYGHYMYFLTKKDIKRMMKSQER